MREKVIAMIELQPKFVGLFRNVSVLSVVAVIVAIFALATPAAHAQEAEEMPARVGRIADYGGQLYHAPEDRVGEWAPIGLNYPIATGDSLWISGEGRAEIDFGGGQFRLAGDTNVHVSRLDEREFSLFLAQGSVIVRVRALDPGEEARVDTPNSQVLLARPGLYRIDVSADRQETTVVVREGEAIAGVTNGTQQILPGQTATLFGLGDVQADVRNGTGLDGFDAWSATRERRYLGNRSATYVSPNMVGYADLDDHGTWQTYPEYGAVWFPTSVAVDWAPYRFGRWVSLPAWGWTWVDDAPWGYAPFHYGRWAWVGGRWGWCPGGYVRRPVWAPALVAWYGGSGWGTLSVGVGGPVYGWVPLGWREPYIPSWRNCGSRCWTRYNRPYGVHHERPRHPPTQYVNHRVPGAITAVPEAAMASGKPVPPNIVRISGNLVATAPILPGAPQTKPAAVTANVVRPGHGVPPPASTIVSRTKPMPVPTARSPAVGGTSAARVPAAPAPAYAPSGAPGAVTAVPPGRSRSAPVYNPAETPRPSAQAEPVPRPRPTLAPPAGSAVTSAPPARYQRSPSPSMSTPPAGSAPPARYQAGPPAPLSAPQAKPVAPPQRADVGGRPLLPSIQPRPQPQARPQAAPAAPVPSQMQVAPVPRAMPPAPVAQGGPAPMPGRQEPPPARAEKPAAKPGGPRAQAN
jgi:hypothetical protein